MAPRTTRQLIKDRLSSAARACDRVNGLLKEVEQIYLKAGESRGMELRPISEMALLLRQTIEDWRRERT